jgi:transcriptional regulator with XRE-family HTH domain
VPNKLQQKQLATLGANIRRERMRQEMTQERLAELVELNIRTVQKVEAGHTNVLATTLMRFQVALKCSWSKLLPSE